MAADASDPLALSRRGAPGSQANRVGLAEALALFLEDRIEIGRFSVTPGLRYESIDLERLDYGTADPGRTGTALKTRSNEVDTLIPGLGLAFEMRHDWHLFAGVHRGFSPPGPSSTEEVEPEESVNYELGTRYRREETTAELVGFWNDYSNLLGADTLSTGGTGSGDLFNGGKVQVYGLEAAFGTELFRSDEIAVPVRTTYTFTRGEFRSSFETEFEDWAPEVVRGDELPYVPEHQLFVEAGVEGAAWNLYLNAHLVSEMRARAGRGAFPDDERRSSLSTSIRVGWGFVPLRCRGFSPMVLIKELRGDPLTEAGLQDPSVLACLAELFQVVVHAVAEARASGKGERDIRGFAQEESDLETRVLLQVRKQTHRIARESVRSPL